MSFRLCWFACSALGAWLASASIIRYQYPSYGNIIQRLHALQDLHPEFVTVYSAQERYSIGSAGHCHDANGETTPCMQWFIEITEKASVAAQPDRPEVFFSGNLHGDEQVGPPTLLALAELLVEHAALAAAGSNDANPWLARLVRTRNIVMLPVSNAIGYETVVRTELGIAPNRDFPYNINPTHCMQTAAARAINEVWKQHMFQVAATFHGGMQAIAYEWGADNHLANGSESPDDAAQARIAATLSAYAGAFQGQSYPVGRLNQLVYPVDGGMEDWGYAAGWDVNAVRPCRPPLSALGPYPESRTDYAASGNLDAFRAFNILVEASDAKRPAENLLGTNEELLVVQGAGDGHVPRNLRLALHLIDIVQPYAHILHVNAATSGASTACDAPQRRLRAPAPAVRDLSADTPYDVWVADGTCEQVAALHVEWDVGGGYNVDATRVLIGRWPAHVPPGNVYEPAQAGEHADVAAWKAFLADTSISEDTLPIAASSASVNGVTRWLDSPLPNLGNVPYSPRFSACVQVQRSGDAARGDVQRDAFIVVIVATLDGLWTQQANPDPAMPPQSHVVNARTNVNWRKQNNGHAVLGRTVFASKPAFVSLGGCAPAIVVDQAASPSPSASAAVPAASATPFISNTASTDEVFHTSTTSGLVLYTAVVGCLFLAMIVFGAITLIKSRRRMGAVTAARPPHSRRGYAVVDTDAPEASSKD